MNPLKTARKDSGLTTKEVTKRLGITQPALSYLENGNPTVNKLAEICEKMNWKLTIKIETLE